MINEDCQFLTYEGEIPFCNGMISRPVSSDDCKECKQSNIEYGYEQPKINLDKLFRSKIEK